MSNLPLVTICIPSFNHVQYVGQAIRSVVEQDYSNIELIVIDDGSSDGSVPVIQEALSKCVDRFTRLEFRFRSNRGLAPTLNEAIQWANGRYFAMLSSDDMLLPSKTRVLVDRLEDNMKLGGAFAGYDQIDGQGRVTRQLLPDAGIWNFSDVLAKRCRLFAPTMLLRTDAIRQVGGYWEDIALEDRAMSLKLAKAGYPLMTISTPVALYRWHETNTIKNTEKMTAARLQILDRFEQTPEIATARAKVLYGAALELGKSDKAKAKAYFASAWRTKATSIFSKPAFRSAKRIWLS